jgi:hypothetical protein
VVAAAPQASPRQLSRARPQAEVDALYASGAVSPLPRVTGTAVPEEPDEGVVAESAWDVPITREWRHIVIHHSASASGCA